MTRYIKFLTPVLLFCLIISVSVQSAQVSISNLMLRQGHEYTLSINADSFDSDIGGFDLLIAVDQKKYSIEAVTPGDLSETCNWEYFTHRIIIDSLGLYDIGDNTDLLQIYALADNGSGGATCFNQPGSFSLVNMQISTSYQAFMNDLDCQFVPIQFYWRDCSDNIVSSVNADTAHVGFELYDYGRIEPSLYPFPGFGVPVDNCPGSGGLTTVADLTFINGGLDFICVDTLPTLRGDVNLNGFAYELADARLLMNYFVYGHIIFVRDPGWQLEQADIDLDGFVAVRDLVLLYRIIIGDAEPMTPSPKISPEQFSASVTIDNDQNNSALVITSDQQLGAVWARVVNHQSGNDMYTVANDAMSASTNDTISILLFDINDGVALDAGGHRLLSTAGTIELIDIQAADVDGNMIAVQRAGSSLPTGFQLHQNYPNPFNPSTAISFDLSDESAWELSIFASTGQLVRQYSGTNTGAVRVDWNGVNAAGKQVASGIYLYRLRANGEEQSRKMLLLK